MALSQRINPHEMPPYRMGAACGESEEDHGTDERGTPFVLCRCDTCGGTGRCPCLFPFGPHGCVMCNQTGYSDQRFTEAVRDA